MKPHIVPYSGAYVMFSSRERADHMRGLLGNKTIVYLKGFNAMARSISLLQWVVAVREKRREQRIIDKAIKQAGKLGW